MPPRVRVAYDGGEERWWDELRRSGVTTVYKPPSRFSGFLYGERGQRLRWPHASLTVTTPCTSAATSPVSSGCFACLESDSAASSWGAIVLDSNVYEVNQGGCYAAENALEAPCAQATQFQQECENAECASLVGGVSTVPFQSCVASADSSQCRCDVTNATSACAGFVSSPCTISSSETFEESFAAIAKVMCE